MRNTLIWLALFSVLLAAHAATAEENKLYKYVDENGVTRYTDDVSTIPRQHQQDVERFDAVKPSRPQSGLNEAPAPKTTAPGPRLEDLETRQKRQQYLQDKQRLDQLGQALIEQNARIGEDLRWAKKRRNKSGRRKYQYKQMLKEQKIMEQKLKEYQEAREDFETEHFDQLE
jgi:hypothetical protein